MRTYEEVQAAIDRLRGKQIASTVSALPPGFKIGCKLTLADNIVTIGVGLMEVKGQDVKFASAYQITGEDWDVTLIGGGTYYIYVDEGGAVSVDSLAPTWHNEYMEYYHPDSQKRHGGTILTDTLTGKFTQVINAGALVAGDIDTTTLETVYAIIAFSEATPTFENHRVYIDRNEVSLQYYNGAAWSTYAKLGGDESDYIYGTVFPYLQAQGIIKTGAIDPEISDLNVGYPITTGMKIYHFDNAVTDQDGTNPWDTELNLAYSAATKKFGTYSLTNDGSTGAIKDTDFWAATSTSFTVMAWIYCTTDQSGSIAHIDVTNDTANRLYISSGADGFFYAVSVKSGGAFVKTKAGFKKTFNSWNCLGISYNAGTDVATFFANGADITETLGGAWGAAGTNSLVINIYTAGSQFIDELMTTETTAMTAAEMLAYYQSNQPWVSVSGIDYTKDLLLVPKDTGRVWLGEFPNMAVIQIQAVLSGPVAEVNGAYQPAYLSEVNFGNVSVLAVTTPVNMVWADGFEAKGAPKIWGKTITANVEPANWNTLVNHGKEYLYAINSRGAITYDKTRVPPQKGSTFNAKYHSLLHFEEATNPTDEYGHTWTASGAVRSAVQKKFGTYSYLFDGTNDYIETTDIRSLNSPFTMECFFYSTSDTVGQYVLGCKNDFNMLIYYRADQAGDYIWYYAGNGAAWSIMNAVSGVHTILKDTWYHIRFEWDGYFYRGYINGVLDMSTASTAAIGSTTPPTGLQIGNNNTHATEAFLGYIDEHRITIGNVRGGNAFTTPTAAFTPDALWFDTNQMKMRSGSPDAWTDKVYLPLGYAVCDRRFGSLLHFEAAADSTSWWEMTCDYGNKWYFVNQARLDTDDNGGANIAPKIGTRFLWLDGVGDYIRSDECVDLGVGSWTLETWWYTANSATDNQTIFSWEAGTYGVMLRYVSDGNLALHLSSDNANWDIADDVDSAFTPTAYTWYHIALVFDGSSYKSYIDGTLAHNVTNSLSVNTCTRAMLGARFVSGWYTAGGFDEFRMSVGTARYTANFTPSTTAFVADGCIKYLVSRPYNDTLYQMGWVNYSLWSNKHLGYNRYGHVKNADEDVEHGMSREMGDLRPRMYLSPTGSWTDAFQIFASDSSGANTYGIQPRQISLDTLRIQTGTQGIVYLTDAGALQAVDTEDWYINIVVPVVA